MAAPARAATSVARAATSVAIATVRCSYSSIAWRSYTVASVKIVPWRLAVEDYTYTGYVAYCCMFIMIFIAPLPRVYAYTRVGDFDTPTHRSVYKYICIHIQCTCCSYQHIWESFQCAVCERGGGGRETQHSGHPEMTGPALGRSCSSIQNLGLWASWKWLCIRNYRSPK